MRLHTRRPRLLLLQQLQVQTDLPQLLPDTEAVGAASGDEGDEGAAVLRRKSGRKRVPVQREQVPDALRMRDDDYQVRCC